MPLPLSNSSKVYLMILDGFGEGKEYAGNAVTKATMPYLQKLKEDYPLTFLKASGNAVGLPEGTQGGSEVGHFTMGAGRIVYQSLEKINLSIRDGSFFEKKPLLDAIAFVKKTPGAKLHLLGMISDQGVHSHVDHLFALLEMAKRYQVQEIFIHAITDGRDVPERSAAQFIEQIQLKIKELGLERNAHIATLIGRYYAMDRDHNWDRTQKAYDLYTLGKGYQENDPLQALQHAYDRGVATDYYLDPVVFDESAVIEQQDAVIFWNYRTDRTRQLTECFTGESELGFVPEKQVRPFFVCFGDYSTVAPVVFPTEKVSNNLGSVLSHHGLPQLRIAETEKYAHVTYFFNSQVEEPFSGETRILVDSPKVASYAEKPAMSAVELTQRVLEEIDHHEYSLVVQNFANPDLVGHSGDMEATVKACESIDQCMSQIVPKALEKGYNILITADHGNAEYMIYENNGEPCPSHTLNPVFCMLISQKYQHELLNKNGGLEDIAPTILDIMKLEKPKEMTGKSLLKLQNPDEQMSK